MPSYYEMRHFMFKDLKLYDFNNANTYESNDILQFMLNDGILSESEIENYLIMTRRNQVTKIHKTSIYQRNDGRYFTKVKEDGKTKQIIAKDEKELYEKLYDFYFGIKNSSLSDIYPLWLKWRDEETSVTKKTIKENTFLWNRYLKDASISKAPLSSLKAKDFIKYFRSITKNRELTRKKFNDIKSIMNGIIYYAIEQEIIEHNYLKDINYREFTYKPVIPFLIPKQSVN